MVKRSGSSGRRAAVALLVLAVLGAAFGVTRLLPARARPAAASRSATAAVATSACGAGIGAAPSGCAGTPAAPAGTQSAPGAASGPTPTAPPGISLGPASRTQPPVRGIFLFGATDYGDMVAAGFNAATGSQYDASGGRSGLRDLVWLGGYDVASCGWEFDDPTVGSIVDGLRGNTVVLAYQLGDEPDWKRCPQSPAQYTARTALVHAHDPGARTFVVTDYYNNPAGAPIAPVPYRGTVDILGVDVYPCQYGSPCDYSMIDRAVAGIHASGVTDFWAVIQDFGDDQWRMPDPAEITAQFDHWAPGGMTGYLVYAWDYLGHDVTALAGNTAALARAAARF